MDEQSYIESGILEAYVLGALTPQEMNAVAAEIAANPVYAAEVRAIEESLYHIAKDAAKVPPAEMKEGIWNSIKAASPQSFKDATRETNGNVRPMFGGGSGRSKMVHWERAALLVLLLGSVVLNLYFWNQNKDLKQEQLVLVQSENIMHARFDSLETQQVHMQASLQNYQQEHELLADTNIKAIVMKAATPGTPMAATVYWNKTNGESYLAVQKMPPPPAGMQYQMWVIQDGKPVSMGVINSDAALQGDVNLLPMRVLNGQAFAISLEKTGGSETPTEVKVVGAIS